MEMEAKDIVAPQMEKEMVTRDIPITLPLFMWKICDRVDEIHPLKFPGYVRLLLLKHISTFWAKLELTKAENHDGTTH